MGMFDHYEPVPGLTCPACGAPLDGWQGKDGDCALFVWRQGRAAPVGQDVPEESRALPEVAAGCRLPEEFEIYTQCCGGRFFVTAQGRAPDGHWAETELETADKAWQRSHETRADFRARVAWLRGGAGASS